MEVLQAINFIDLTWVNVTSLIVVGFIAGMVSGFIGSGGAFVLTPAMMSFGAPGIVAVASNMAHKFPKALVAAIKRNRYGQVDVKLGLIMGIFAEAGVLIGKNFMTDIRQDFGDVGTDLYVSAVFVVVLAIVGGFVMRDAMRGKKTDAENKGVEQKHEAGKIAKWVQSVHIPGTMMYFKSIDAKVSVLFIAPLGFATGLLAASIAVGGFIGVPAMIYILGVPAVMATATELVVAFVMGMGGSMLYAFDGFVDIRLAMLILGGSLFGVQIGAIGTTYVKEYVVKYVMGSIMLIVLVSRLIKLPVYLDQMDWIAPLSAGLTSTLNVVSFTTLILALVVGALSILIALIKGIAEHKQQHAKFVDVGASD
ncbi:MAG: sulfite exporter TauE/SafE family protein [Gammaproteobacteria bacterium]|nr:sulfite exporter TauE/SafE family protein [Gammaproteobacteria bacterium]